MDAHDPRLILLDAGDNVFVARMRLKAGEAVPGRPCSTGEAAG
ncbi:hypothetical protein [Bosea sp. PAMC 26642]|nr:hypothetical protein [Bosea sp. PAMC 26642]